jgi:putative ABC transport system permease protein
MSFQLTRLVTFRSIKAHRLRFMLSTFGIVLGVAAMLAINVTNQTALESIQELFQSTSGNAKLTVTSADAESSQGFPEKVRVTVENTAGVKMVAPLIKAQTKLSEDSDSEQLALSMFGANIAGEIEVYGIIPDIDRKVRSYKLTDGHFLSSFPSVREIVLVDEYAEDKEVGINDWIGILTPNGVEQLKIVGLIAKDGVGQTNNGDFGIIPLKTAQELFNRDGYLDQMDILTSEANPSSQELEQLKGMLQTRLGREYLVSFPANQGERMTQMLQNYQIGLNFMSGIALFVGAFLIYNAFAMTVIERTREFGLLRTIGMTRGQVTGQMLLEATFLGVLGSLLGLGLGVFLASGMTRLMGLVLNQSLRGINFPLETVMVSFLVGLVVTFLAAGIPALQAGRISPLEALRIRGRAQEGWLIRWGWIPGVLLLVASIAILFWNPFPYDVQFRMGSMTVFGLFAGATLLIPATVTTWERAMRPVFKAGYGSSGSLGSRNVQRARQRTTLTVAALMIGVAMVIITRSMTQSFAGDLRSWLEAYLGGDIYIGASIPLRSDMVTRIELVPGVEAVAPVRYFNVDFKPPGEDEIQTINFMAYDPVAYSQVTNFSFSGAHPDVQDVVSQLQDGDSILLSSVLAEKYHLGLGDGFLVRTRSGYHTFRIAAIVVDFYNQGLVIQGTWDDMRRYFHINDVSTFMVKVQPGYRIENVQATIDDLYKKRYSLVLESNEKLRQRALNLMSQAIGMRRANGMTRTQIVTMILAEAGLMGLLGGLLGLITGIILARVLFFGMTAMSGYQLTFVLPAGGIILTFVVAFVISQIAAIFPGRRASRIKILEAVHYE